MFLALILLTAPPPTAWDAAGVAMADAYAFGVPPDVSRANYLLAQRHRSVRSLEVRSWNLPATAGRWEAECRWREWCWDKLDDVVNCPHFTLDHKLRSLSALRDALGDEAYFSGRMPAPIPTYRDRP